MEIREIKDKNSWEGFLLGVEEKTFLQSWNWGEFQGALGEKVWRFGIYEDGNPLAVALVVKVGAKRGRFLFVPHGPIAYAQNQKSKIPSASLRQPARLPSACLAGEALRAGKNQNENSKCKKKILESLLGELKKVAEEERCSFIRIAPAWERSEENKKVFKDLGFREAPIYIHPELTWQMNLEGSEEELLRNMRKTTRYLIRQALENKDLKIEISQDLKTIEVFNGIYQATSQRQHFVPFSLDYLKNEFLSFVKDNQVAVFLARYCEEYIAAAAIIFWQGLGFYHQGASLQKYAKVPASYLLQWEAIREAKRRGCRLYNFWGIADVKSEKDLKNHPWAGLTLFKMGFGGYERAYLKTQDLSLTRRYWFNYVIEKVRRLKRGL